MKPHKTRRLRVGLMAALLALGGAGPLAWALDEDVGYDSQSWNSPADWFSSGESDYSYDYWEDGADLSAASNQRGYGLGRSSDSAIGGYGDDSASYGGYGEAGETYESDNYYTEDWHGQNDFDTWYAD